MIVLLVERDWSLQDTLKELCELEGFKTITVTHCDQARKLLDEGLAPSIIFCEEFLPTDAGRLFQNEIKNIPFVLMLSFGKPGQTSKNNLMKPFAMDEFIACLKKIKPS